MSTLSEMRANIADDLNRSDLSTQIDKAINRAIEFYGRERFWFNETTDSFTTVDGQQSYGTIDGLPSDILEIDYLEYTDSSNNARIAPATYQQVKVMNNGNHESDPQWYAWFEDKVYFYPTPNDAYTINVSYQKSYAELNADGDSNDFTNHAQDLIEARAQWWLYSRVIKDVESAAAAKLEEQEALRNLIAKTQKRKNGAYLIATEF